MPIYHSLQSFATRGSDPEDSPRFLDLGSAAFAELSQAQDRMSVGWRDLTSPLTVDGVPSQNAPTLTDFVVGTNTRRLYAFDVGDYINFHPFHIDHDVKPGGKAYLHAHWSTNGTNTASVKWEFQIVRARGHNQENFYQGTTLYVTQATNGTAYRHMIAEVADADALTLLEPDELVYVTLKRVTNGGTNNTDAVFGLCVDFHYETDRHATPNKAPNFFG